MSLGNIQRLKIINTFSILYMLKKKPIKKIFLVKYYITGTGLFVSK